MIDQMAMRNGDELLIWAIGTVLLIGLSLFLGCKAKTSETAPPKETAPPLKTVDYSGEWGGVFGLVVVAIAVAGVGFAIWALISGLHWLWTHPLF